jgi:outer membrane protein assembly factor BamB
MLAFRNLALGGLLLLGCVATEAGEAWPEFRGPFGDGHVQAPGDTTPTGLPTTWSETENVAWKTAIPLKGWSTPVVMDGQVWLTTATEEGTEYYVIAVDAASGAILHNKKLFESASPEPLGNNVNCYASPSPAIEAGRVYVHFGVYGTACLDTKTAEVIWQRTDLPCQHYRGPGSSAILFEDLLILTFDGIDQQYVTALDKKTGETKWRTDRTRRWEDFEADGSIIRGGDMRKSFSTPLIVEQGGKPLMLSVGSSATYGYDPRTGQELWKVEQAGFTPSTRPVWDGERMFTALGYGATDLWAIRTDGAGDVSATHVAWKYVDKSVPETPSPILVDGLLYTVSNRGEVTCFESATGTVVWSERIGGNFIASPILADGLLYFTSSQGTTKIIRAGRAFELVAENKLDDGLMASPAVAGKALFLRTPGYLYRIESKS